MPRDPAFAAVHDDRHGKTGQQEKGIFSQKKNLFSFSKIILIVVTAGRKIEKLKKKEKKKKEIFTFI